MGDELNKLTELHKNDRAFFGRYIVGERQKWRDYVRTQVDEIQDIVNSVIAQDGVAKADIAAIRKIRAALAVRLSPEPNKSDSKLLEKMDALVSCIVENKDQAELLNCLNEVVKGFSWLLKEDWERVKHEARPIWRTFEPKRRVDREKETIAEKPTCWINILGWIFAIFAIVFVLRIAWQKAEHWLLPNDNCDPAQCLQKKS